MEKGGITKLDLAGISLRLRARLTEHNDLLENASRAV
jgi:hypothetical protein